MITPAFAFIVFIVIIIVSIVGAWLLRDYASYDKSTFHTFISILMGLGVFVTFMFYYAIVEEQQNQRSLNVLQQLSTFNTTMLNSILKEINKSVVSIPQFISSINPLTMNFVEQEDSEAPVNQAIKTTISYRLFSIWQDYVLNRNIFNNIKISSEIPYICTFLQKSNSQMLFEMWKLMNIDFIPKCQDFGNLLFEYGLKITKQTPEEYYSTALKLCSDPRFLEIID